MRELPKVSVITPALNSEATITECLQSVAAQDYADVEHIVVDGASTDGTLEILRTGSVAVISEQDTGIYDAINKGIAKSRGEIIHVLNADDRYKHDGVISRMVKFILDAELDAAHARVELVDTRGRLERMLGREVTHRQLLRKCRVAHPSVFVRRSVYERFGNFSTGFEIAGDHDFLLRIWDQVKTGFLPETTTVMRSGGISTSQVVRSYRESMAVALLHGRSPLPALLRYYLELIKAAFLKAGRIFGRAG